MQEVYINKINYNKKIDRFFSSLNLKTGNISKNPIIAHKAQNQPRSAPTGRQKISHNQQAFSVHLPLLVPIKSQLPNFILLVLLELLE